jgi:hypothetical protein
MFLVVLVVGVIGFLEAQEQAVDLSPYRNRQPVIVVFSADLDDVRPFSFNLDLSSNWARAEARNLATLDVDAINYDVEVAARQFGLGDRQFAVILVAETGEILMISEDPAALEELFAALDAHREG